MHCSWYVRPTLLPRSFTCFVAHRRCHIFPSIGSTPSSDQRLNTLQTLTYPIPNGYRPAFQREMVVLVWDVWPRWHFQPLCHRLRVHCLSRTPSWWSVPVHITVLFRTIWAFGHLPLAPSRKISLPNNCFGTVLGCLPIERQWNHKWTHLFSRLAFW